MKPIVLVLATATLAPTTSAAQLQTQQNPQLRRGIASVWAAGLSVRDRVVGTSGLNDPILHKNPGDQSSAPPEWTRIANSAPDYSMDVMFPTSRYRNLAGEPVAVSERMDWDGMSTGNDLTPPVNAEGVPDVSLVAGNWLTVGVSVIDESPVIQGSYLATVAHTGSEILSYCFEGSQNLPASLPGSSLVEQRRSDFGFPSSDPPDIDAFDYAMGSFTVDPDSPRQRFLFPVKNEIFFSVTREFADWFNSTVHPAEFADLSGTGVPAHAGDIYHMIWLPGVVPGTGNWLPPMVYRSASELQFDDIDIIDVDGLAVNAMNGVIVFSTPIDAAQGMLPQLLVFDPSQAAGVLELKDDSPTGPVRVVDKLSIPRESDVDGVCGYDPEGHRIDPVVGIPRTSILENNLVSYLTKPMGISLQRARPATGVTDTLHLQVTGWGDATPQFCWFYLYVRTGRSGLLPQEDPLVFSNWTVSAPILRMPTEDTFYYPVPGFRPPYNEPVAEVFAVLVDLSGTSVIAGSWATQIEY